MKLDEIIDDARIQQFASQMEFVPQGTVAFMEDRMDGDHPIEFYEGLLAGYAGLHAAINAYGDAEMRTITSNLVAFTADKIKTLKTDLDTSADPDATRPFSIDDRVDDARIERFASQKSVTHPANLELLDSMFSNEQSVTFYEGLLSAVTAFYNVIENKGVNQLREWSGGFVTFAARHLLYKKQNEAAECNCDYINDERREELWKESFRLEDAGEKKKAREVADSIPPENPPTLTGHNYGCPTDVVKYRPGDHYLNCAGIWANSRLIPASNGMLVVGPAKTEAGVRHDAGMVGLYRIHKPTQNGSKKKS